MQLHDQGSLVPQVERRKAIAEWITQGAESRKTLIDRIISTFGVGRSTAYGDLDAARHMAANAGLNNQLVTGALALQSCSRVLGESERFIREDMIPLVRKQDDVEPTADKRDARLMTMQSRVHTAYVQTARGYAQLAATCFSKRPTDMMTAEEGKALLLRALEQGASDLRREDKERLRAVIIDDAEILTH